MASSKHQNFFLIERSRPIRIAHRGANDQAPENTMAAFREAVKLQADAIELDVQLTLDNQVVVFHDSNLARMTNGAGRLANHSYAQLQDLKIDSGANWKSANQPIPLLSQVLDELGQIIPFQIELKTFYGLRPIKQRRKLVRAVIEIIHDKNLQQQVMLESFDPFAIKEIKRIDQTLVCGYLMIPGLSRLRHIGINKTAFNLCQVVAPHHSVRPAMVKDWQKLGKKVIAWTVDDANLAKKMADIGVDGIVTNQLQKVKLSQ